MRSGFIISVIAHAMVIIFILLPSKDVKTTVPQRFIKASLIEYEQPQPVRTQQREPETTRRPPPKQEETKPDPEPFRRPDEKYEKPKNQVSMDPKPKPEQRRSIEETPRREARAPVTVLERDFESHYYLGLLRDKVYRNWDIEDRPFRMECIVRFQINRKGNVENIKLEQSSGFYNFDRAAMRAIAASEPFPPLPSNYGHDRLTIFFRFENL